MLGKNREIAELEERCNNLRQQNPNDLLLPELNREIRETYNALSRSKWREFANSINRQLNPSRLWSVMQRLLGKKKSTPSNQPI